MEFTEKQRLLKGENIVLLFNVHTELLGNGYRCTKTGYRDISGPVLLFKDYYLRTNECSFDRTTIKTKILLDKKGNVREKSDVVNTGIRTMQDLSFLASEGDEYVLTHQFFDWINSGDDIYKYFVEQTVNIRAISEIRNMYNALYCMFHEWILHGYILDFSTITDAKFISKVNSKRERARYCEFVKKIYGFEGNIKKDPSKSAKEGNYCPDCLQRVRTVFNNSKIIQGSGTDKNGIKKFILTESGLMLLEQLNHNLGIILSNGDYEQCDFTGYVGKESVDAPKLKRASAKGVGRRRKSTCCDDEKEIPSKTVKDNAKLAVEYTCELELELPEDQKTKLFIERSSGKNYVEGHHFIPMEYAKLFNYSVDVEANVVCLCPRCHRLLHHGLDEERKTLLTKLFEERKERLNKCRLLEMKDETELSIDKVYEFYKIG